MARPPVRFLLGVKDEYLKATGAVTGYWAFFESHFDNALENMRLVPEAEALTKHVPLSFRRRADLFRDLAEICFRSSPALVARFDNQVTRAKRYAKERNRLVHGTWLEAGREPWVLARQSGKLTAFTASLADIQALANDIEDLFMEHLDVFWGLEGHWAATLASDERLALQEFRECIRPKLPATNPQVDAPPPPSFRE